MRGVKLLSWMCEMGGNMGAIDDFQIRGEGSTIPFGEYICGKGR